VMNKINGFKIDMLPGLLYTLGWPTLCLVFGWRASQLMEEDNTSVDRRRFPAGACPPA
jgi:hypothetical protein